MDKLENKAKEYGKSIYPGDCLNRQERIEGYKDGYKQAQRDLICKLADFLHISLTFEDPILTFEKIMNKK